MNENKKHGGGRNGNKDRDYSNNSNGPYFVTLPYDFVPLAKRYRYPYTLKEAEQGEKREGLEKALPAHDQVQGLSGCLHYEIRPYSELVLEIRHKLDGTPFISGSQIRGKIRANLEILSASYPSFVDRSPMLYRDFEAKHYKKALGLDKESAIEEAVRAGFLMKDGQDFYVIPAEPIGKKYFLSIKEHRLRKMGKGCFRPLFLWNHGDRDDQKLQELQEEENKINNEIAVFRESLEESISEELQKKIMEIGRWAIKRIREALPDNKNSPKVDDEKLIKVKDTVYTELCGLAPTKTEWHDLFRLYSERWKVKAQIDQIYSSKGKNPDFEPYQHNVYYKLNGEHSIEKIMLDSPGKADEQYPKGYLFNSTNAHSKRSHYFIGKPETGSPICKIPVPESVKYSYNQNLKKIHSAQDKFFYDIFDGYEQVVKELVNETKRDSNPGKENRVGLIVFFRAGPISGKKESDMKAEEISDIGRTPYFKTPYPCGVADLINPSEKDKIDYAKALFGFVHDDYKKEAGDESVVEVAYKSRLRFTPVDVEGEMKEGDEVELLLPSPSASAAGMYLQQGGRGSRQQTYLQSGNCGNDGKLKPEDLPKLNGLKYYHVLRKPLEVKRMNENEQASFANISSHKVLTRQEGILLKGKIHFRNLSEEELGLLLLSLDIQQLLSTGKYKDEVEPYKDRLKETYELIGGGKPYGYGKVTIRPVKLEIEKDGHDFESLIMEPLRAVKEWQKFIDAFIEAMEGKSYFGNIDMDAYIESKKESGLGEETGGDGSENLPRHIVWGGGSGPYNKKRWRLFRKKLMEKR